MSAILLASAGVVILLVGGGIGYWAGRSGVGGSKAKLEKAEAELEDYKRSVTEHFGQTAEHFQAIGKQYRELYEHMASGAQTLCEPDDAGKQLLFAPAADAVATEVAELPDEGVVDDRPPADFAEEPVAEVASAAVETTDTPVAEETSASIEATEEPVAEEAAIEPAGEQQVEKPEESKVADMAEAEVSEAANDPQSETPDKVAERTLH